MMYVALYQLVSCRLIYSKVYIIQSKGDRARDHDLTLAFCAGRSGSSAEGNIEWEDRGS